MSDFELVQLPKGIEGFLSELKPVTSVTWNTETKKYEIDKSAKRIEADKKHLEEFKSAVRDVFSFSESISRGTPKFCLALRRIWDGLPYIEDSVAQSFSHYGEFIYKPSLNANGSKEGFAKIIEKLGVSSTSAYRYKDLAVFVDENTNEFYTEFQGYSISLLSEIYSCACDKYDTSLRGLKELAEHIPSDTTIDDIRLYRKALKELNCCGGSLFENYSYSDRAELKKKPLKDVLEEYNKLVQKAEMKKLENTLSGVRTVAIEDKSKKILPSADEMTVKREEYQKIFELSKKAVNIGNCDGCKYRDTNLNKCRCCRRYESLKDLFEKN